MRAYNERHIHNAWYQENARGGLVNLKEIEIPRGTTLYRIGHFFLRDKKTGQSKVNTNRLGYGGVQINAYSSPWWFDSSTRDFILNQKVGNAEQVARVALAIHPAWGGDCFFMVEGQTRHTFKAWKGAGHAYDSAGNCVDRNSPHAVWIPPNSIEQLYIPGISPRGTQVIAGAGGAGPQYIAGIDVGHPDFYWRGIPTLVEASAVGGVTSSSIRPDQFNV